MMRTDAMKFREERRETDDSLRAEREKTDGLLERDTLGTSTGDTQGALLPEVSDKLEHLAASLTAAAASLTGVADSLKESLDRPPDGADRCEPAEVITNMAQVADRLKETADESPTIPETSGKVAEQLAEIAEGMAQVTSTLAEERRDADELLRQERQATDDDLAEERRQTDDAVDHVMELLTAEQRAHHSAARNFAARNEFLGIVSHDLRGPLTTITGGAELIERCAPAGQSGEQIRTWADTIRRSAEVMERLIHDLLDFGSLEDGRLRVKAELHDIAALVRTVINEFHAAAAVKSISLATDLPAGPVIAKYDRHRVHQVLSNLVQNAIKFTREGGTICIRVSHSGTECLVAVTDTGIGIPKRELKSVFERFRQLDGTDRSGLGLGLYISMSIVEAHGGRIWAESEGGAGSAFYFTLPD